MQRIGILALCATLAAPPVLPAAAAAQEAAPATAPAAKAAVKAAPATKPSAKPRRRKPAAAGQAAAPALAPAPAASSYELVPSRSGSALARARQNSFEAPDDGPTPTRGSRRIGVGLGGANGTSPGMASGF